MGAERGSDAHWLGVAPGGDARVLTVGGRWEIETADVLSALISAFRPAIPPLSEVGSPVLLRLDLARLDALDTVGALLLRRLRDHLTNEGYGVVLIHVSDAFVSVLDAVWAAADTPVIPWHRPGRFYRFVENLGRRSLEALSSSWNAIAWFGMICTCFARVVLCPRRLRLTSLVYHMEHTGFRALPILGLLSFLVGVVLAYQGAEQLRRVGGEIYVANLLGLSILREIGVLITAIIVAGRSGSAFTAQIGTMKVNQEVDAMLTLGLDPLEILVLPRMLALMLVMPLLVFIANMAALTGGASMAYILLDITYAQFVNQMRLSIDFYDATVAMIKAPVFALVIAMVGCYEGLRVTGSAESVGLRTTRSVVESIFFVIILNAFFSIIFTISHI